MPQPPKPLIVLESERRSHRTKAELAKRREEEKKLVTGVVIKEWPQVKASPIAHKEFRRLKNLLGRIDKSDALYQNPINRYCMLFVECEEFKEKREQFMRNMDDMADSIPREGRDFEYYATQSKMQANVISCDRQVMQKRKMMFDIEKECLMTIAAALRSIPKKPDKDKEEDPMAALLGSRKA